MEYKIGTYAIEEAKRCKGCGHVYQDLDMSTCDCNSNEGYEFCFIGGQDLLEKIINIIKNK